MNRISFTFSVWEVDNEMKIVLQFRKAMRFCDLTPFHNPSLKYGNTVNHNPTAPHSQSHLCISNALAREALSHPSRWGMEFFLFFSPSFFFLLCFVVVVIFVVFLFFFYRSGVFICSAFFILQMLLFKFIWMKIFHKYNIILSYLELL